MKIENSKVGEIRKNFILGDITENEALKNLVDEVGKEKADVLIEQWKPSVLKSSLAKAISSTEDYFGTLAEGDTVVCQDIITYKDSEEIKKIAEDNGVKVKIGQYSVTFYDVDEYLDNFTNVLEVK